MKISKNFVWPIHSFGLSWIATLLLAIALLASATSGSFAATVEPLFDAPASLTTNDEIFLVSTRGMGTVCNSRTMLSKLDCQRLVFHNDGRKPTWKTADWRRLLSSPDSRPTIIYVHGNRVAVGLDREQGMQVYRSMKLHSRQSGPVRFVIWSWPSAQIPGPVKDYRVKAQRTNPAAWQLAWVLDKLPVNSQISLVGYSYGTRVVSGAAHLLAGGHLGSLQLAERNHPDQPKINVALMAAAYDANWLQPGQFYGRAIKQMERLVLGTNALDPAMRFFHLSNGRGRMDALGKSGVYQIRTLGKATRRLRMIDFSHEVSRSHAIESYLAAHRKIGAIWRQLTIADKSYQTLVLDEQDPHASAQSWQ